MKPNAFHQSAPDFSTLYVFGAGSSGREIAWLAQQSWATRVRIIHLVDRPEYATAPVNGNPVQLLGEVAVSPEARFVVAVGDPGVRRKAVAACESVGLVATRIVHPRVEASSHIEMGPGVLICAGSILTTNIRIGQHVHINLDCTVSHDVVIGEFAKLSPGVHVSGNVNIGRGVLLGTGANIINGSADRPLVIADNAVIAAGACVTKSVDAGALVAGVPAIRKR